MCDFDNEWHDVSEFHPDPGEEVLVLVDGHRGPSWRNNYARVAYLTQNKNSKWEWRDERNDCVIEPVIKWKYIKYPEGV